MTNLDKKVLDKVYEEIIRGIPERGIGGREIILYGVNGQVGIEDARYISERLDRKGFRSSILNGKRVISIAAPMDNSREYPVDLSYLLDSVLKGR